MRLQTKTIFFFNSVHHFLPKLTVFPLAVKLFKEHHIRIHRAPGGPFTSYVNFPRTHHLCIPWFSPLQIDEIILNDKGEGRERTPPLGLSVVI